MIRVGLVGCGRMGEIHLQIVKELQGVQIVGVADSDGRKAKGLAARGPIGLAVDSLEALLKIARPDAVHILTPPASHARLACTALTSGCHVFVEKPMALTIHEAGLIVAAAGRDQILTVGHNHLFDPAIREARARVAEGRLGQLVGMDAFHGTLPGGPAWLSDLPSGPWVEDAPHLLYLVDLFMGEAVAVRAIGYPTSRGSPATEIRVVLEHRNGVSSLAFSTSTNPYRHRLALFGTKRTLEVDLIAGTLVETRPFSGHRWLTKGLGVLDMTSQLLLGTGRNVVRLMTGRERSWPGLRALLDAYYLAIREGGPSPVPATEGARVVQLLEEIQRLLGASPDGSDS